MVTQAAGVVLGQEMARHLEYLREYPGINEKKYCGIKGKVLFYYNSRIPELPACLDEGYERKTGVKMFPRRVTCGIVTPISSAREQWEGARR